MIGIEQMSEVLQWLVLGMMAIILGGNAYVLADFARRLGTDQGPLIPNDGLEDGAPAPDVEGVDKRTGRRVRLADYDGQRALVAFLAPGCGPCGTLVPHLNRLVSIHREIPIFVIMLPGKGSDRSKDLDARVHVLDDPERVIGRAYQAQRTPLIYLLSEERKVAHHTISNDLVDLEDTLNAIGRPQGNAPWIAAEPSEATEPTELTESSEPTDLTESTEASQQSEPNQSHQDQGGSHD